MSQQALLMSVLSSSHVAHGFCCIKWLSAATEIVALRAGLTMVWSTSNKTLMGDVIVGQHHVSLSSTAKQKYDVMILADGRQHQQ